MVILMINIFMDVFIFTLIIIFLTVQAHPPILNIVLGKIMWKKLTRRVCYDNRTSYYKIHEETELWDMRIQVGYIKSINALLRSICPIQNCPRP